MKVSAIGKVIANRSFDYHRIVNAPSLKKLLSLINYIHSSGYHHACGCIQNYYEDAVVSSESTGMRTSIKTWKNAGSGLAHLLTDIITIPRQYSGSNIYITDNSSDALYLEPGTEQNRMRFDDIIEASFDTEVAKYSGIDYYITNSVTSNLADIMSIYIRDKKRRYLNTDTDVDVFDPRVFSSGNVIRATDVSSIRTIIENMKSGWEKTHVNQFARYQTEQIILAEITTTPVNIMDTSSTVWDEYGPGYWIHPQTPGTKNFAAIQAKIKIISAGTTHLKIVAEHDESDEVTSSGSDEITIDFNLPLDSATDEYKIEIHARADSGTVTLEVNRMIIKSIHDDTGTTGKKTFNTLSKARIVPSSHGMKNIITVNSVEKAASFVLNGGQATVTSWPTYYGSEPALTGNNNGMTVGVASPFHGALDGGVKLNGVAGSAVNNYVSPSATSHNIGTEDFIFEIIRCSTTVAWEFDLWKSPVNVGGSYLGYLFVSNASGQYRLVIGDADLDSAVITPPVATANSINIYHFICDRSGYGIGYVNGVAGSAVDISAIGDMTQNSYYFKIGNTIPSTFFRISMWKGEGWLDSHSQDNFVKERVSQLMSIYPILALGTALPEVI